MKPLKICFLCTGNSCRSQMAEALARKHGGTRVDACSAGVEAHGLNPRAVHAMSEIGIDISGQRSTLIADCDLHDMDYVITLCGDAADRCPVTPASVTRLHWPFPDPARAQGTEEQIRVAFADARDALEERIAGFVREILDRTP
ncbi:MAG: arsenate reductase (thioredoxin) [Firmicutes bacterium]|nr:arsenate reductase (thioredoxin) [Bacillota bacterium]